MRPPVKLYLPLRQSATLQEDIVPVSIPARKNRILAFLVLSNLCLVATLAVTIFAYFQKAKTEEIPLDFARTDTLPTKWNRFDWWTEYSSKNDTAVDALWDAILPSHGIIAVDRQWAAQRQWPESMALPNDESKGLYLLEAYHLLHCVKIIRKTFWEAVRQDPYTYKPAHAGHCFDSLRQYIQCQADNTPLYSFGDYTAGDGQLHKCKDWDALRDWATEHTACYADSATGIPLQDHFGHCDNGQDGLIDAKKIG